MAQHIYVTGRVTPEGRVRRKLLYVFDIKPRLSDGRADVVKYPASGIPREFSGEEPGQISASDPIRSAMDVGDVGYVQTEFEQTAGEADDAFMRRAALDRDALVPYVIARARDAVAGSGVFDLKRLHVSG